jgi:hypothetical protein
MGDFRRRGALVEYDLAKALQALVPAGPNFGNPVRNFVKRPRNESVADLLTRALAGDKACSVEHRQMLHDCLTSDG